MIKLVVISWSNVADFIGTGQANADLIISQTCHLYSAAKLCDNYTDGAYIDWFLPSKDELSLIYANLYLSGVEGFAGCGYWNS